MRKPKKSASTGRGEKRARRAALARSKQRNPALSLIATGFPINKASQAPTDKAPGLSEKTLREAIGVYFPNARVTFSNE